MATITVFPKDGSMEHTEMDSGSISLDYTAVIPTTPYDVWVEADLAWVYSEEKEKIVTAKGQASRLERLEEVYYNLVLKIYAIAVSKNNTEKVRHTEKGVLAEEFVSDIWYECRKLGVGNPAVYNLFTSQAIMKEKLSESEEIFSEISNLITEMSEKILDGDDLSDNIEALGSMFIEKSELEDSAKLIYRIQGVANGVA